MKKILIIAIILVLIGGVLLFLASRKTPSPKLPITNYQLPINQAMTNQSVIQPRELTPEEKLALLKNELKIKARNFVERYGSFSTDARFANLKELKDEMSSRLWRETENYILAKEKEEIKEFYGVTTKVLSVEEKSFSENEVTYLISTQRQETKGQTQKVFYQNLELKMIKEDNVLKVDKIQWK